MEIIPVKYARSTLPEKMIFVDGDANRTRKIVFQIYLIKKGKRLILVDAGCETMPGFDMKDFIGPIQALENAGFFPQDITDVVLTHAHHDHIECVRYFTNALIHIEEKAYERGKKYIPDHGKVHVFQNQYEVTEGVRILKIGGHVPGSCIVEIQDEGKTYIITGDECYLRENIEKKLPTGSSFCPEKSKFFIEKYSNKQYTVLLCHDE